MPDLLTAVLFGHVTVQPLLQLKALQKVPVATSCVCEPAVA